MSLPPREVQELQAERVLLQGTVAVARRCRGRLPPELLDAVLSGARTDGPSLPSQRPDPGA